MLGKYWEQFLQCTVLSPTWVTYIGLAVHIKSEARPPDQEFLGRVLCLCV
jgi:hypothetical protein